MTDIKAASALSTAAFLEIISAGKRYQAAILRGASQKEQEALRGKVHDLTDAFLDRCSDAAHAALFIAAKHPDAQTLAEAGARKLEQD